MSLTKLLTKLTAGLSGRTLCVALAPERLSAAVRSGARVLPGSAVSVALDHPAGHWEGAVAALRAYLTQHEHQLKGLPLAVSLSSRWCQLAMLPWSDALLDEASAQHFAATQFAGIFGEAARGWRIVCDDAPYGEMRLACAIDKDLLGALQAVASECGHRLCAVESNVAIAARAISGAKPAAMALHERGRVVLAQIEQGRIVAVQAQPCRGNWHSELAQAWQRWSLRAPELAGIDSVALVRLDDTAGEGPLDQRFQDVRLPSYTLAPSFAAVCMMGA